MTLSVPQQKKMTCNQGTVVDTLERRDTANTTPTIVSINCKTNAVCGSANHTLTQTAPSAASRCSVGTVANYVAASTEWSWDCVSPDGGAKASCKAFLPTHACLPYKPFTLRTLIDGAIDTAIPGIKRAVFAHNMSTFRLATNAHSGPDDGYNKMIDPSYYSGKAGDEDFRLTGGRLRMRPLYAADVVATSATKAIRHQINYANAKREIRMALARGITGFTQFIGGPTDTTDTDSELNNLLLAAATEAEFKKADGTPRFRIMIMMDVYAASNAIISDLKAKELQKRWDDAAAVKGSPLTDSEKDAIAKDMSDYKPAESAISSPLVDKIYTVYKYMGSKEAAYKLPDGSLVVTTFQGGTHMSPDLWQGVFDKLKLDGIKVAFFMGTPSWRKYTSACTSSCEAVYDSKSAAFADWGNSWPSGAAAFKDAPALAHSLPYVGNKILFMTPATSQRYHVRGSPTIKNNEATGALDPAKYWDARNSELLRTSWDSAINGGADFVQMVTWSDFDEGTIIQPYTDRTLAGDIGTGFYNLTGYYTTWYLKGVKPTITHDVLYYFYRRAPVAAKATTYSYYKGYIDKLGVLHPGFDWANKPLDDSLEVLAFVKDKSGATLTITFENLPASAQPASVDVSSTTDKRVTSINANLVSVKIPMPSGTTDPGRPTFTLTRGGKTIVSYQAGVSIYGSGGIFDQATGKYIQDLTYWSGSGSEAGRCILTVPDS